RGWCRVPPMVGRREARRIGDRMSTIGEPAPEPFRSRGAGEDLARRGTKEQPAQRGQTQACRGESSQCHLELVERFPLLLGLVGPAVVVRRHCSLSFSWYRVALLRRRF